MLVTNEPVLYFLFGLEEYMDGEVDRACASWRRSLELGSDHLPSLLEVTHKVPSDRKDLDDRIFPDDPEVLLKAGVLLAQMQQGKRATALWERALHLAQSRHSPPEAGDLEQQARILHQLGRPREAVAAYRAALTQEPRRIEWRYGLAQLLVQQSQISEARQELNFLLGLEPGHAAARDLLQKVSTGRKPR
jgi:tetratricopeptide (TPR) repeat protein